MYLNIQFTILSINIILKVPSYSVSLNNKSSHLQLNYSEILFEKPFFNGSFDLIQQSENIPQSFEITNYIKNQPTSLLILHEPNITQSFPIKTRKYGYKYGSTCDSTVLHLDFDSVLFKYILECISFARDNPR